MANNKTLRVGVLGARLTSISEETQRAVEEALKAGVSKILEHAEENCPVDTGELKRSLRVEVYPKEAKAVIYTNCEYAPYVEFGTGIYATKGEGRETPWVYPYIKDGEEHFATTRGQAPNPFLGKALRQSKKEVIKAFEDILLEYME